MSLELLGRIASKHKKGVTGFCTPQLHALVISPLDKAKLPITIFFSIFFVLSMVASFFSRIEERPQSEIHALSQQQRH